MLCGNRLSNVVCQMEIQAILQLSRNRKKVKILDVENCAIICVHSFFTFKFIINFDRTYEIKIIIQKKNYYL